MLFLESVEQVEFPLKKYINLIQKDIQNLKIGENKINLNIKESEFSESTSRNKHQLD
jgi:hypothetical protein